MTRRRTCPDCTDSLLEPIKVIEHGDMALPQGLKFAAGSAQHRFWTGYNNYIAGQVHGFMCGDCGRVLWYALSEDDAEALFKDLEAQRGKLAAETGGSLSISEANGGSLTET